MSMLSRINEALLRLVAWVRSEQGQALSEYGLIIALVAVACIVALGVLAAAVSGVLEDIGTELNNAIS